MENILHLNKVSKFLLICFNHSAIPIVISFFFFFLREKNEELIQINPIFRKLFLSNMLRFHLHSALNFSKPFSDYDLVKWNSVQQDVLYVFSSAGVCHSLGNVSRILPPVDELKYV